MPYNKPYLTIPQQIAKLQSRGMDISSVAFAEHCLQRIGYYRFSAYYYPYRVSHPSISGKRLDTFLPRTTFQQIADLYDFDRKLRLLVIDAIEKIEIACRAAVTLELGKRGGMAHIEPVHLDGKFIRPWVDRLGNQKRPRHEVWTNKMSDKFKDSKEDFVCHFKSQYPSENPPIWIASELWDFGMTSNLLSGLKYQDRTDVAQFFGVIDPQDFCTWIRSINFIRNICAHHSRLWNRGVVDQPSMPKRGVYAELDHFLSHTLAHHKIYASLAILSYLVKKVWPNSGWGKRLKMLMLDFPVDEVVDISQAGFPAGWENEDIWQ